MAKKRLALPFVVAALMAGFAVPAAGQGRGGPPPRPPQPVRDLVSAGSDPLPAGKGAISGVVVVAGVGQPARRARVTLNSPDTGRGRTAMTDDSGRFAFTALPEGRYNLSASKPGHISGSFGQRIPGRSGTPIQLTDGQQLRLQMQIWRGSVITGTVLDEQGEAIPNTPVRVLRYVFQGGQRVLQPGSGGQTDDRGVYRVFGLQPGEYLVSATPRNVAVAANAVADQARAAVAAALERVAIAGNLEVQAQASLAERARLVADNSGDPQQAESGTGYAPVYYPGTTSPASATSVTVGPGEEKTGIDFSYQVVPVARIDGVVTSSTQLPPNVQITLVNTAFNVPGLSPGSTRADANGSFRISNVPPGQYTLVARATIGDGRGGGPAARGMAMAMPRPDGGGRGAGPAGPPEPTRLWGSADVSVDGRDATNVVILLQPGVQVSGRVTFDGGAQPPADLSRMRVTLQPIVVPGTAGELVTNAAGRVEADGRFTIASVVPGRYRLTASNFGEGWFLASSSIDGQDSVDSAAEIKGAVSNATVTLVDRRTELTGTVTNEKSEPVSDYTLIVFPADARYRTPQSRRITSARPATDGRYAFRNLPPGDYRIAPVLDPEPGSWFDPAFLEELEKTSLRFSIGEGEKKEQNLRVPGA